MGSSDTMFSREISMQRDDSPSVIDLFGGVGGFSLGAARAGFNVCGAVEIDPKIIHFHKVNFPCAAHLEADVSKLDGFSLSQTLQTNDKGITGIIGGPPCQGFSIIGKRNQNDIRNRLFVDFFRVVSEVLPVFFVAENVPGILQDKHEDLRQEALSFVNTKYNVLPPMRLSADDYGAATNRTRVFFVGCLAGVADSLTVRSFDPPPNIVPVRVKDALHGLPRRIDPNWKKGEQCWQVVPSYENNKFAQKLQGHIPPSVGDPESLSRFVHKNEVSGFLGIAHTSEVLRRYAETECGSYESISRAYRLHPDGLCPTLRAGTGTDRGSHQALRPIHPTEHRAITPREAARLQGFPDWFQFSPTKWHSFRQIGNSVCPILAEHIFTVIADSLQITRGENNHGWRQLERLQPS